MVFKIVMILNTLILHTLPCTIKYPGVRNEGKNCLHFVCNVNMKQKLIKQKLIKQK